MESHNDRSHNDSLGLLLIEAAKAIRKTFERRANHFGLSSSQWRLLVVLGRLGQTSQSRLAETLDIEPISVSRLIDRMEGAGWVERHPDPNDRRARIIVPTDRALQVHAHVREIAEQIYADALVTVPPEDRPVLMRALVQITANLGACNASREPEASQAISDSTHSAAVPLAPAKGQRS